MASLAEAWLAQQGGWLAPRLPGVLLALQTREKVREQSRADAVIGVSGLAIVALFYVVIQTGRPDLLHALNALYRNFVVPAVGLSCIVLLRHPKPIWRDLALGVPCLVALAALTWFYAVTGGNGSALLGIATMMLMLFGMMIVHLRFDLAVIWMAAAQVTFAAGIAHAHDLGRGLQYDVVLIGLACGVFMLLANRRLDVAQQREFAFALQARWRGPAESLAGQSEDAWRRDSLTGLANRRAFDAWLQAAWTQAASGRAATVGLIMLDADRFALYNEFYGHPAGDACLAMMGSCLREQLRGTSDQIARIGGEAFAVVLPGVPLAHCGEIAERLRAAIAAMELPHLGHGTSEVVTISCGCASLDVLRSLPRDVCAAAEAALSQAKQSGRNRVCLGDVVPAEDMQAGAGVSPGARAVV